MEPWGILDSYLLELLLEVFNLSWAVPENSSIVFSLYTYVLHGQPCQLVYHDPKEQQLHFCVHQEIRCLNFR